MKLSRSAGPATSPGGTPAAGNSWGGGGGVPPGSPNPHTKKCHFPHPFPDLAFRQMSSFLKLECKQKISSNVYFEFEYFYFVLIHLELKR